MSNVICALCLFVGASVSDVAKSFKFIGERQMKGKLKITINFEYHELHTEASVAVDANNVNTEDTAKGMANAVQNLLDGVPFFEVDEFIDTFIFALYQDPRFVENLDNHTEE